MEKAEKASQNSKATKNPGTLKPKSASRSAKPAGVKSAETKAKVPLMVRLNVRLSHTEKMLFTKYFAVLLKSGVAIDEAIDILLQQSKGPLKKILETLKSVVEQGRTLAEGLSRYSHVFSPVFVNLVRAGEASGTLQNNLDHLASQLEKEHNLRKKVRGAMMYPMIVLLGALIVGALVFVFVLPKITSLFESLDVELPFTTRALLWSVDTIATKPLWVFGGLALLIVLVLVIPRVPFLKPALHWMLLRIPVFGRTSKNTNLARMTRLMGTLLDSGVTINEALTITKSTVHNHFYRRLFDRALDEVSQGQMLAEVLGHEEKLVPPMALRLIRVGEETGTLPDMMTYLATFYEEEVDSTIQDIATLIEPFLILTIGLLVGILAFSIISPIYQVVGSV
ncbi:hypothetical protein A3C17_01520 [Candidatus Uhrbacteria bacterium RIFCSPHIGHO2_02_FULL_53_13]|uniref:Type II secretion system protein GspF domain-containing protein n=2 Tax=Candidatus Uhriibacteriota TaxID=1752732 RepID=A0A1F7TVQ1_9BACT|nr:MAG: hypothetical protein A3C17_01520 [Candidatus Uhrbacteria bacterium RIFCSPHIGHO2_02_FULL_53_13]OGL89461.1 MAG: hypothetical protein A3I45_02050 [Candidatus Uhrbacteria bacterium RIFCSPLOWO2_02_FULL_53_10]